MSAQPGSPLNNQDWADSSGRRWADHLPQFEAMLAPVGAVTIAAAKLQPGEGVVDVGSGGGRTTLAIAERVGPNGRAVGIDVSAVLVEAATEHALAHRRPGSAPVRFILADAAAKQLDEAPFDVLFSRFGVMFFADPIAAFRNLRGWLKPTGRLAFACWAPPKENPWLIEVQEILGRFVDAPKPDPLAPGPFAFADMSRVRDILTKAGFASIAHDAWRGGQAIGGVGATPAQAADFAMTAMHVGQMLADQPETVKAKARAEVEALFAKHHTKDGVTPPSTAWIVTAKAS